MEVDSEIKGEDTSPVVLKRLMEELLSSKGWGMLATLLQANLNERVSRMVFTPTEQLGGGAILEFMKGEAAAFNFILNLPTTLLENAKNDLKKDGE
jgi:hypothetical protein